MTSPQNRQPQLSGSNWLIYNDIELWSFLRPELFLSYRPEIAGGIDFVRIMCHKLCMKLQHFNDCNKIVIFILTCNVRIYSILNKIVSEMLLF